MWTVKELNTVIVAGHTVGLTVTGNREDCAYLLGFY